MKIMKRTLILVISLILAITFLVVVQFGNDINWTDKGAVQKTASFERPKGINWVKPGSVGPIKTNSSDIEVEEEVEEESLNFKDYGLLTEAQYPYT